MSLSAQEISRLVGLGLPVLCVDTCTVLDVGRDITRESVTPGDGNVGRALLEIAGAGPGPACLRGERVTLEIAGKVAKGEEEAQAALEKVLGQAQRIHEVAGVFGAQGHL